MVSRIQSWLQNHKIHDWTPAPESFVLVVLLIFGSFLAFRIPLGAGFDEETHLLRVWEMSAFELIPNTKLSAGYHFPAFYWENSYRRQAILEPVDSSFWVNNAATPIDGSGYVQENLTTRSVYSPLLLLPQSLVMFFLGQVLHLPALTVLIAMRLAGLLSYTLLVWLAVRLAPFGKWLWAILVIAPMAIYQASTISTDTISNGIGFLFVAGCLYLASLPEIRWKEWLLLGLLFFLLFSAKVNMAVLGILPFLLIPPRRFKMKRGYLWLGLLAIFLALLELGGWNLIAYSRFNTALPGANPIDQLGYLLTHPLSAVWVILSDLGTHLLLYLKAWIADYGYGYWGAPWLVYPIYLAGLLAAFFINDGTKPDRRTRLALLLVFGLSFLATLLSLYISYTPVGSPVIEGVHGRYFTVIFPLLLLGLFGLPSLSIKLEQNKLARIAFGAGLVCLLVYSVGMYMGFYVRCGTAYYQSGLCYQPRYKNWSPDANYFQPISPTFTLTQWIIPKCNGMSNLRIWVDSAGSDPNGETEFILTDEENDAIVLDEIKANTDLPSSGWLTLPFPADRQSGGKWYTLTVQSPLADQGQGIQVASSIRAEYVDGPLLQYGVEGENDIIFQYGCVAGWQKLFTDVIALVKKD